MVSITGENFIGNIRSGNGTDSFQAFNPTGNVLISEKFTYATEKELERALSLAQDAFVSYKNISTIKRAEFLEAIAEEIMALEETLIERAVTESGLPIGRITGERGRTFGQLKMFAQLLRDGWYVDARIDTAQPERVPLPKSDIRRMLIPIGPVAVYGASNFPLAFSTAGGDTASALAAGCPVIVKTHPSHPGTSELISSAIIQAAKRTGMPEGVFSALNLTNDQSVRLVQHPAIKAVGFTGSRKVGMTLFNAAAKRPEPIPVYAEMSAINPVILMEEALKVKGEAIAKGLAGSVTMGAGQFCTNPGLVLLIESEASKYFLNHFVKHLGATEPATMLNKNICQSYSKGIETTKTVNGVNVLAEGTKLANDERNEARSIAFTVSADDFLSNKQLNEEVFGPVTLFVLIKDTAQLHLVLNQLEGQLTATVHAEPEDKGNLIPVIDIITQKAGRVIYNGFPTGVEVCHSMQHGGPFPSTTDGRSTSVGTAAIYRFLRPVSYQDIPDELLPAALQNSNPLSILRLIDGSWKTDLIP
ncbi:aldehyde dehydrogenase (NADP(+)) [Pedobacter panaciterrae]|jgi:NAD-dependent aldehyde dehydrogenases|uniref:aldehyde dehydrogenase (NADP(+)) n=1 Tax=Pedobacter panaciterrae TaxID=363849 RepID=UPI00155D8E6B|nr:aldehyde dehydrogenase (NADP(+)) [Pedobacter panaciterrae]NQX56002.1 aldehyde dehydrogenase (NADP(+)) [Pedobacter panaciterrae]